MRRRDYGLILSLIEMLPRHSKYKVALEEDELYIEQMREAYLKDKRKHDDSKPTPPPMDEWSPERDTLADILHEIRGLSSIVIGVAGGGKQNPEPPLRPVTPFMKMVESAKIEKRKVQHERLVGQLLPHKRK